MSESDCLTVRSRLGDYVVRFHEDWDFLNELAKLPNLVLLADRNILERYKQVWSGAFGELPVFALDACEANKTLGKASEVYEWITENFQAKRNLNFVSIGGGITQDMSGFVASTLFRGINWYFVPTTLLAQADSCIGGKTSLNFKKHKNLLGTFYPPHEIHIAPQFTRTLTSLDLHSGYGEVLKFLLMRKYEQNDGESIGERMAQIDSNPTILKRSIRECLDIKRSFMEEDEFDRGRRNLLNYGHCFGHALEAASGYRVPHGIAVNVGMMFANLAAVSRKTMSESNEREIRSVLLKWLYQCQLPQDYDEAKLLENLKNDKKRTGRDLPLVIPVPGGLQRVGDFTENEFHLVFSRLTEVLFNKGALQ